MAYKQLILDKQTPPVVEHFVRQHLDMQFNDVHCMLRLPLPEFELSAGCNFAIANSLCALVSGISSLLTDNFDTSRQSGDLFKKILQDYYPWDLQPSQGSTQERSIDHLYDYFRNPLAHSLGIKTRGNFLVVIAKNGLSEAAIEKLEQSQFSPGPAIVYTPITIKNEQIEQITLDVANFYWGIREMLKRLSNDTNQMRKIEQNMKSQGLT